MRRFAIALSACAVVAAACSNGEPAADDPAMRDDPVVVSTTAAPDTTTAPDATAAPDATTSPPPETTAAPTTTTTEPPPPIEEVTLALELVADSFRQPVFLTAPEGDRRFFVVDQPGVVYVLDDGDIDVFLDVSADVSFRGERGLLGLAFHPEFDENGLFYVNYTARDGATNVVAFTVSADDPDRADPDSATQIIRIAQPAGNHNGGMIAFGPEGNLWIGMGDGGGANDQFGHGQRADTLLGAMLRIRVGPGIDGYEVPSSNPFVGGGGAAEVWATGLRNPWRFSFGPAADFGTPVVIVADVGQNRVEEVSIAAAGTAGLNYGWPITEGDECFRTSGCDDAGLVPPVATYDHGDGCSVTGGFVYEGTAIRALRGHYLYGDFCSGFVRSIRRAPDANDLTEITEHDLFPAGTVRNLTSFGKDGEGELYLLTRGGSVFKLVQGASS